MKLLYPGLIHCTLYQLGPFNTAAIAPSMMFTRIFVNKYMKICLQVSKFTYSFPLGYLTKNVETTLIPNSRIRYQSPPQTPVKQGSVRYLLYFPQ